MAPNGLLSTQHAHHLDARRDVRIAGLQGLWHGVEVQRLYARARLLGQDVSTSGLPTPPTTGAKYFTFSGGTPDNSQLWDSIGQLASSRWQRAYYSVNYNAILNFILNVGPCPFPAQLVSGRIVYYTAIPTTIDTSTWPPTDPNQRFWKDYIDYVLGLEQTRFLRQLHDHQQRHNWNDGLWPGL